MATADPIHTIDGATVRLTRAEMYGLVNTAERLGDLISDGGAAAEVFGDQQAKGELEAFDDVSRAVGRIIAMDFSPPPHSDLTAARVDTIAAAKALVEALDEAGPWPQVAARLGASDTPAYVDPAALSRLITALLATKELI